MVLCREGFVDDCVLACRVRIIINILVNWKDDFFFEADLLSSTIIPIYIAIAITRTIQMFYFCSGVQVIEIMNLHMYSSFLYFSLDQFNWMIFWWGCLDSLMLNPVCPGSLMIGPFLLAINFICKSSVFEGWSSSTEPQKLSREGEVGLRERSHFQIFAKQTMTGGRVKKAISGCFCFLSAYWVVGREEWDFVHFQTA